jgi:hypothetical protein
MFLSFNMGHRMAVPLLGGTEFGFCAEFKPWMLAVMNQSLQVHTS